MKNTIHIREANIQDKPIILNLIKSFSVDDVRFAKRYYDHYFSNSSVTGEDLVLVADINNQVIGVCGYGEDYFCNDHSYYLSWFVVDEKFRGWRKGEAAAKLLAAVEKDLRKYHIRKLYVHTTDAPDRGQGFYLKHGFQFEARLKDYYNQGEDQLIFGKVL